ncbi:MAG: immunoglobulin domain-containing protein, partial [Flavisolibacter sp.]
PNSFSSTSQNPSIANATTAATGTYSVTVTLNGCTSAAGTTNAIVNVIPTITGTTPGDICVSGNTVLSATATNGSVINWYDASTGGAIRGNGNNFSTDNISATRTYYVDATANGCTSTPRIPVVAAVNARPTITSTTNNSRCGNGAVTLNATSSSGTVNWYANASGGSSLASGTTYSPNISSTTTYYVDATISGCTTSSRTAVTATKYTAAPSVGSGNQPVNMPTGPQSICPPVSNLVYNIPASMTSMNKDASTYYKWSLPPGFVITSGDSTSQITVSVSAGAPTIIGNNQNVSVIAYNPCGNSGTSPRPLAVNVNSYAGINAGPNQNICVGTSATMAATYSGNTSSSTWSLSGSGTFSDRTSPTSTFTPSITSGDVTLTITTNDPSGVCNASSSQVTITIDPLPTAVAGGSTTICSNGTATVSGATATNGTILWTTSNGGGSISNATTLTPTYNAVAADAGKAIVLTMTVTSNNSCGSLAKATAIYTINVDPLPTAVAGGSTIICSNGTATVSGATATNGTILWTTSNGGGSISNATTLTPTYNPVAADGGKTVTLTMTVTGSGTCSSQNATANYTITVNQLPQITSPDFAPRSVCASFPVTFSVTATGTGLTYQWYKDGIALADTAGVITGVNSANLSLPQAKGSQAGTYTVRVSGVSPCGFVTSSDAVLTVNQQIDIISQPVSQTICEGLTTTFEVQATGSIYNYVWRRNGTPVSGSPYSGENSASLTITGARPSDNGNYDVVISAPSGTCSQIISSPPAVLTVTPTVGTPTAITVLAGTEPTCQLLNGTTTTTYATTATNNTGFNWVISNATAGAIDAATGVMTWANGFSGSVDIQVTASGCNGPSAQVVRTVTIAPTNTAASPSSLPTLCINTAISPAITIATTGATGIGTPTGLPAGVTASWASNTITISGTPIVAGPFNYSIPLSGGCGTVNATGTITVTPANTAGIPSSTPTLCINTPLTNITIATTGATGIGTATGLPAGVTASWASNTITISGTPTVAGPFNYSIPLSGGCGAVNATGTITVTPANTAGIPSSTPTLCINTPLTNI